MTTALGMSENLLIPGQRLGFEDVEAGAGNPIFFQGTDQCRFIDNAASSRARPRIRVSACS